MTVKDLLETLTEDAAVTFQDRNEKTIIRFEYGQDIDVFSTGFLFRKVKEVRAVRVDRFITVLGD